jgi:Ca2+-binding RTX toxin-like protein
MLYGGAGADTFVLGKGHGADRVMDFSMAERDRLAFDDNLWTGKLNARQVVEKFASVTEAGVVFDFGRGNMLVLEDLTTTDGLSARIGIF